MLGTIHFITDYTQQGMEESMAQAESSVDKLISKMEGNSRSVVSGSDRDDTFYEKPKNQEYVGSPHNLGESDLRTSTS